MDRQLFETKSVDAGLGVSPREVWIHYKCVLLFIDHRCDKRVYDSVPHMGSYEHMCVSSLESCRNLSLFCHTQKLLQRAAIDIGGRALLGKSCKAVPTPAQEQDDAVVFD
jgi:hypothetical protein